MPNFASVTIVGHLGADVSVKSLPSGDSVANFSIATTRKRRDAEVTTWWRCALFGKRAETFAEYLHKGDPVLIQGEPYQRSYTAKDGSAGVSLEVDVKDWAFVGSKGETYQQESPQSAPAQSAPSAWDDSEDIPF